MEISFMSRAFIWDTQADIQICPQLPNRVQEVKIIHVTSTSIAEQPEPKERMVQVVKWYLSAFHAGRKGSVAKKPYNPILGEVFFCHWDLPSETEEPPPHMVRPHVSASVDGFLIYVNELAREWLYM